MGQLDVSGVHSSDGNDCMYQAWVFLSCSARRGPGPVVSRKVDLWQHNGKNETGMSVLVGKKTLLWKELKKNPHPW